MFSYFDSVIGSCFAVNETVLRAAEHGLVHRPMRTGAGLLKPKAAPSGLMAADSKRIGVFLPKFSLSPRDEDFCRKGCMKFSIYRTGDLLSPHRIKASSVVEMGKEK